MELKKNQCHYVLKLLEFIALSKGNSSLLSSEELGVQISYSSSSTAVAISLGINVLLSLLDLPVELGLLTSGIVEVS